MGCMADYSDEDLRLMNSVEEEILKLGDKFFIGKQYGSKLTNKESIVKKIVPVVVGGTRMNWWLNVKNPIYREIVNAGITGQKSFKILQTGTQANTKYVLVK